MTSASSRFASASAAATARPWIARSLEALWLLVVVMVPLIFLDRDFAKSEALIAYVEVPKIVLLRTLVGLMAILWLIEWGIQERFPSGSSSRGDTGRLGPGTWPGRLKVWLRNQPTRWLTLAVVAYLATTLLTTVLSASFNVSMWGEVPGQDGYPAYTVLAYVVLFGVISTHLKTRPQLWRLLGAVVGMGMLVTGYAVFQHYGHDFLNLTEVTGGGRGRVTSTMGNAIFSAAVMLMTISVSLLAAVLTLRNPLAANARARWRFGPWLSVLGLAGFWGLILAVQLLGIAFTFSRGPWLGTILAVAVFIILAGLLMGWRTGARAILVLGLAVGLALATLQLLGSVSILGQGPWLGPVFAVTALLAFVAVFAIQAASVRVAVIVRRSAPVRRFPFLMRPGFARTALAEANLDEALVM